jgi:hypothetical protein
VKRFLRLLRKGEFQTLEADLREGRPAPPSDFVQLLAKRVQPQRTRTRLRVALAAGLTIGMVAALASFGGLGYASSAVKPAVGWVKVVKHVVAPTKKSPKKTTKATAAANTRVLSKQYPVTLCHHPPGNPSNAQTITVGSQSAAYAHIQNHPGDHEGPCGPDD